MGYKMAKWGTIPQNGVHLAALFRIHNKDEMCEDECTDVKTVVKNASL